MGFWPKNLVFGFFLAGGFAGCLTACLPSSRFLFLGLAKRRFDCQCDGRKGPEEGA